MQTFGFYYFTTIIIVHMKNLNKTFSILFITTLPFALFAQPSEYVRDAKTKTVVPTEQRKMETPIQRENIPFIQSPPEVSAKAVVEPERMQPVSQPVISPVTQSPVEVSIKSAVQPIEEVLAVMRFEKKTINFGTVKMGAHPTHIFYYKNNGQEPVEIEIVSACDCTEVEYSKKPVVVGATGFIKATFMSERAPEAINKEFDKEITIVLKNKYPDTGYPMVETLKIKGNVIE